MWVCAAPEFGVVKLEDLMHYITYFELIMVTVEIVTPMSDFVNELGGIAHILSA